MALRAFGAAFVVLTIGYWLLVGQFSVHEAGLALGGGALAALWAVTLSRVADVTFRFDRRALTALADAAASVPQAAARVVWVLLKAGRRRPRGSIGDQRCERDDADATRRATILLGVSLAPDRFAVTYEGARLRVHRLGAAPHNGEEQWPT